MRLELPYELGDVAHVLGAFVLAIPIGWERERHDRSMGMRTFPLIAVASCAFLLVADHASTNSADAWNRTLQGVATGVGFLGAGAIVKHGVNVVGTATAAGVWMTAAMGAAAALGSWTLAVTLSVLGFVTLKMLRGVLGGTRMFGARILDRGDFARDREDLKGHDAESGVAPPPDRA